MPSLPPNVAKGRERREHYYELRREGLNHLDAAAAIGVLDPGTRGRYERWFQAVERGDPIIPGRYPLTSEESAR